MRDAIEAMQILIFKDLTDSSISAWNTEVASPTSLRSNLNITFLFATAWQQCLYSSKENCCLKNLCYT